MILEEHIPRYLKSADPCLCPHCISRNSTLKSAWKNGNSLADIRVATIATRDRGSPLPLTWPPPRSYLSFPRQWLCQRSACRMCLNGRERPGTCRILSRPCFGTATSRCARSHTAWPVKTNKKWPWALLRRKTFWTGHLWHPASGNLSHLITFVPIGCATDN